MDNKKNIVIIGDSWGIIPTGVYRPGNLDKVPFNEDKTIFEWLDFKLMSLGHNVANRSWGGSNNFYQITLAETYLDAAKHHGFNIDLVIWFHSELLKEVNWHYSSIENPISYLKEVKTNGLEKGLDLIANDLYQYVNNLHKQHQNTKWAIIGAGAPIRESKKHLLSFADLIVENLRSEITNSDVPECHSYYTLYPINNLFNLLVEKNILTEKEAEIEIEKCKFIENLGLANEWLNNGRHPTPKLYTKLVQQIINVFNL